MRTISKADNIRARLARARSSPIQAYRELTTGEVGWGGFLAYELLTCVLGPLPGAVGFALRQKLYRSLREQRPRSCRGPQRRAASPGRDGHATTR